jgi:four helix bundle protein
MSTRSYRDLVVWQKSMDLVEEIYRLTKLLPKEEIFGIANQLRRAAISIPSNIAEGNTRNSQKEYVRFLSIARGSESEIETRLEVCLRIGYFNEEQTRKASALCIEVGKMLYSMILKLSNH